MGLEVEWEDKLNDHGIRLDRQHEPTVVGILHGSLVYSVAYVLTQSTLTSVVQETHLYQIDWQREKCGEPYNIGHILVNHGPHFKWPVESDLTVNESKHTTKAFSLSLKCPAKLQWQ